MNSLRKIKLFFLNPKRMNMPPFPLAANEAEFEAWKNTGSLTI